MAGTPDNDAVLVAEEVKAPSGDSLTLATDGGEVVISSADGAMTLPVPLGFSSGGHGLSAVTAGDIFYGAASDAFGVIAVGSAGQFLGVSGGIPAWAAVAFSDLSGSIADGQVPESAVTQHNAALDHGTLAGLGDDDHAQYHTDARALTWLGTRSTTDLPEGTNLYYTDGRADARIAAAVLDDLSDVTETTITAGDLLRWNGSAWVNYADSNYAASSHTHDAADVTTGTFADARISQSSVTQHQAALSIGASQVTAGTFGTGDYVFPSDVTATTYIQGTTGNGYLDLRGDSGASSGLRLTDAGHLALGTTDVEAWHTAYRVIQASFAALAFTTTGTTIQLISNAYSDGTWRYDGTNGASMVHQDSGSITLRVAASGSAGTAINGTGSWTDALTVANDGGVSLSSTLDVTGNVGFNGQSPASPQTYTPTNVTTDRSYDANSTSTAELADVLGTLIADLQTVGLLT